MSKPRVLLIGWDAADWKVIRPLLDAGQMPNFARLMAGGVHGNIATLYPPLSPMLWTSIATGKRAYKHGVHGFSEPLPDGSGIRPVSLLSRKTKAIWNILNQTGRRSLVVGWWPSHPAEPINGVMVSNHFQQPVGEPGAMPPLPPGTVHPQSLATALAELRVNPMELSGEFIRLFVPEYEKIDQAKDKRLHTLGKIIAETMSIHGVATELLATQPWDFAGIYFSGIDHFGHAFMGYHPPQLPWISDGDFALYQHVIANAYRYHDAMLGTLLSLADDNTTVILMSDHGFHPDQQRLSYIPAEPAGPAVEHRHFGILCLKGPGLRANEPLYGASLLDICPTILTLFGLPPGKDMDGKVLLTAFNHPPPVEPIESWDDVPGDAGTHASETRLDPAASAEAFKQLVELGYVAPPGPNVRDTVDECTRELKYNLARSYRDGNRCADAAALAEELWARWPKEHRFGLLLLDCLTALGQVARRRDALTDLGDRIQRYKDEAAAELAARAEARAKEPAKPSEAPTPRQRRLQFEERQLRELANGRPLLMEWLLVSQALLEHKHAEARQPLAALLDAAGSDPALDQRLASALMELGDTAAAIALLNDAIRIDSEDPRLHAQMARIRLAARQYEDAIASATESLSLVYFQPSLHALLGQALMEVGRLDDAEKELLVGIAQSPRNLTAHELLGKLYRTHLNRPADAFAHEGRALSLRHELAAQTRADNGGSPRPDAPPAPASPTSRTLQSQPGIGPVPAPFGSDADPSLAITVVSGLPRSGTSMMMQLLSAAGRQCLSDSKRAADEDNPLGYFELEKVLALAKDSSWMPEARGKVIKIVAQLLPSLPPGEHYNVVFMDRNLDEVVASQGAMLRRQKRRGADLPPRQLVDAYAAQLQRVRAQLAQRPRVRVLNVNYAALVADPPSGVDRLAEFLGEPFDRAAAAAAIHPELRRQKA
jgi:predicted AlkP superfamily phosphohydrolase/phosphomutase/tetratricopeptide (TPR) repeat protein